MKMMKRLALAFALAISATPLFGAEIDFCPNEWSTFSVNGHSSLEVWGTGLSHPLIANPDYDWPSELSVAMWLATLQDARDAGRCMTIYYDPNLNGGSPNGHDIWSIAD